MIWKTLAVDKMDIEKTADLKCISRLLVEKWHVKRRWRTAHKGASEGASIAVGCKADPTSTTPLSAPSLAPGAPPSG